MRVALVGLILVMLAGCGSSGGNAQSTTTVEGSSIPVQVTGFAGGSMVMLIVVASDVARAVNGSLIPDDMRRAIIEMVRPSFEGGAHTEITIRQTSNEVQEEDR